MHNKFESGELIVSGRDTVEIVLPKMPHHANVHFKKHPVNSPCDHPHHNHDKLEWEIVKLTHHHDCKYMLIISWKVSSVREIIWSAEF